MAVGDAAKANGYALVPDSGEEGRVRWGGKEINRTRDYIAGVENSIPTGKPGYRAAAGITISTSVPTGGSDGDIHFKIIG